MSSLSDLKDLLTQLSELESKRNSNREELAGYEDIIRYKQMRGENSLQIPEAILSKEMKERMVTFLIENQPTIVGKISTAEGFGK